MIYKQYFTQIKIDGSLNRTFFPTFRLPSTR